MLYDRLRSVRYHRLGPRVPPKGAIEHGLLCGHAYLAPLREARSAPFEQPMASQDLVPWLLHAPIGDLRRSDCGQSVLPGSEQPQKTHATAAPSAAASPRALLWAAACLQGRAKLSIRTAHTLASAVHKELCTRARWHYAMGCTRVGTRAWCGGWLPAACTEAPCPAFRRGTSC